MASGLLSLKWNNHRSTFFHVLSSIRSKESYCDATLACDGRFYPVHKLVLSTCSEYFEQIFERTQCKHPVIVLKDIKYDDLEALMNYMYVGEVNVLQEKLAGLIKAAECLKIKGLAVPDEDPLSVKEKRSQHRADWENPHAKRRRREDPLLPFEDREPSFTSRNVRLSQRDHHQISQLESQSETNLPEASSVLTESDVLDDHTQNVDSDSEQPDGEQSGRHSKQRRTSGPPPNSRPSSQNPIPEVNIDDTSVKAEPPDIQEEEVDSKENLHTNLGYDPAGDGDSLGADPASVASGSNEAGFSDSNMMDATPQSVEDVVAQAMPPTSSSFQGNSFPMWEGEGSLQNFPGEGYSGENSQGRAMVEVPLKPDDVSKDEDGVIEVTQTSLSSRERHNAPNSFSRRLSSSSPPVGRSLSVSPSSVHSNISQSSPLGSPPSTLSVSTPNISHSIQSFLSTSINSFRAKLLSSPKIVYPPPLGGPSSQVNFPQNQLSPTRLRLSMPCTICSKIFPTPTALKVHIRTHTGEKPFGCQYCLYRTAQKGNLATHMRTHTGEKPFVCSICSNRFKSGSALTGHMRSKH